MVRLVIAVRDIPCCEKLICCTSVMGTEGAFGVLAHPGIASVIPSSEARSAIFHFLCMDRFIASDPFLLWRYGDPAIQPVIQPLMLLEVF